MAEYVTNGNLRTRVDDIDEPIEGFKKKTWVPPAEWGPFKIMSEGMIRPRAPRPTGDLRFLSGVGGGGEGLNLLSVPYERLYFEKVDTWVSRLIRPVHGYDTVPRQPDFNDDDLCPVPVSPY
ncbi:hypothetical protein CU669_09250 [Paramagnetospirillum kuznetsovii]|uniref:Uncharacterized protein n=1 Tax=Paramagnetospirillum kuznetsovii TaxID=2053833 RepID=A0A364NYZ6_9PROT|nr:hypothetical protein [Paramagnetospirillum kuznetsovii]RAU22299.1 hypothetical protein CU669_09250 [Paramagnetospirillum kuznetsovii]